MAFVLVSLAGCGSGGSLILQPTPIATSTPVPTATPTVSPAVAALACGSAFAQGGPFGQVGDFIFTKPKPGGLSYPGLQLLDGNFGNKPYRLSAPTNTLNHTGAGTLANPSLLYEGGALNFTICNASSTQKHVLQALTAKVTSLVPDISPSINVEAGCDASFSSKTRVFPAGGCGGAIGGSLETFKITWPGEVTTGTSATSVVEVDSELSNPVIGSTTGLYGNFPVTLEPGKTINLHMEMAYPAQAGTYSFAFGLVADNAPAVYPDSAVATDPIFLALHPHVWSGDACYSPTYQAQIPSTGPEQFYVCPDNGS